MLYKEYISIESIVLHYVGNKLNQDGINFSKEPLNINKDISDVLLNYFLKPFNNLEFYNLSHETSLDLNEIYQYVSNIFNNPDCIFEQSKNISKHLYENSRHPKIKKGEFYIVHFKDCIIDGTTTDAIGFFKSENKDTYIKIFPSSLGFEIASDEGININKLDKGCLIFNAERDKGYLVAVVDTLNKGAEARYWKDDFLHVKPRKDEYFHTENIISLCRNFTSNNPDVNKSQKADILNKAVSFLKDNEAFDMDDFSNQIMEEERMKTAFQAYRTQYEKEQEIVIVNDFAISDQALKKQSRLIKNVIKLDSNFKISLDGDIRYLEKGYDENRKLNFYKLYFKEEE